MKTVPTRLPNSPNYGRIARVYRLLEYVAFGGALQRSRETFLERLADSQTIAVFGGGDGRCFDALLRACPQAQVDAFDIDPVMIAYARRRAEAVAPGRVCFHQVDARTADLGAAKYDAVITQFFLDCFSAEELDRLIPKITATLRPKGQWLFADFTIPSAESPLFLRWRARAMIAVLCAFFRWQVQHPLDHLPPMEAKLEAHGWQPVEVKERSGRMVRTVLLRRAR